jgi:hypothetical protein
MVRNGLIATLVVTAWILLCAGAIAQDTLYVEHFTDGQMQLRWYPGFSDTLGQPGDSMEVIEDVTTPGGDGWAGRISNEALGMAGLTFAGNQELTDYTIEAWVYCIVAPGSMLGPYNGLVARFDTTSGGSRNYYRLVTDFSMNRRIRLGAFLGGEFPIVVHDWPEDDIPFGVPESSGWYRMALTVKGDTLWAYWEGVLLPECPIVDTLLDHGYFGLYTFSMDQTAETRGDDIAVLSVGGGVGVEGGKVIPSQRELVLSCQPNPMHTSTTFLLRTGDQTGEALFVIYDPAGRLVTTIGATQTEPGLYTAVWRGTDTNGRDVPSGIYFCRADAGDIHGVTRVAVFR